MVEEEDDEDEKDEEKEDECDDEEGSWTAKYRIFSRVPASTSRGRGGRRVFETVEEKST